MLRKLMIGLVGTAAIAVIAFMAMPTDASARGWHGHSGGWHGGYYRGGFRGPGYGFYGYPYAYYPYAYGCYRNVRVATPYGWGWRRVYVCG